uniref:Uncharacterized protein n=1 Tax=Arundo donax TaxID=35708 RepID=A0A0A9F2W5_ARUDO
MTGSTSCHITISVHHSARPANSIVSLFVSTVLMDHRPTQTWSTTPVGLFHHTVAP